MPWAYLNVLRSRGLLPHYTDLRMYQDGTLLFLKLIFKYIYLLSYYTLRQVRIDIKQETGVH